MIFLIILYIILNLLLFVKAVEETGPIRSKPLYKTTKELFLVVLYLVCFPIATLYVMKARIDYIIEEKGE